MTLTPRVRRTIGLIGIAGVVMGMLTGGVALGGNGNSAATASMTRVLSSETKTIPTNTVSNIHRVDWKNTTVPLPGSESCPTGKATFHKGNAKKGNRILRMLPEPSAAVYHDVNSDGQQDALLSLQCGVPNSEFVSNLIAVTVKNGQLQPLETVTQAKEWLEQVTQYSVEDGLIKVTLNNGEKDVLRYFCWDEAVSEFVEVKTT